jgi:hydrogenase nickel incorporation protein HypA/HybF
MHELSVCQDIISQVEAIAREHRARAVSVIELQIGPLSGVEIPLLEQAFTIARAGTVAGGAELRIESLPVRVYCESCGAKTEATVSRLVCGQCGDWKTRLVSGDEMLLARLELELESDHV